jgi:hypothetical protein
MALPMIAAGIAARAVAKKLATRAAGGITGKGAKSVNPVYKMMDKQVTPLSKSVKIKYNKQTIENSIKDRQLKTKRPDMSPSRPVVSPPGSGRAIKINSNPMRGK